MERLNYFMRAYAGHKRTTQGVLTPLEKVYKQPYALAENWVYACGKSAGFSLTPSLHNLYYELQICSLNIHEYLTKNNDF